MQCQGTTRSGSRCRNNSLNGELFCDVHTRVNHSRNLTLLIPGILTLLGVYFILMNLFLETSVYNVFNIPYLQYVGLEDVVLGAIKFAAVIIFILIGLWIAYSFILSLIFSAILVIEIFKSTQDTGLRWWQKLKITTLSVYILCANIFLRLLLIIPSRGRIKNGQVKIKKNRFSRTFLNLKDEDGEIRKGRPFLNAQRVFQRYLFFKEMGNHKFVSFSLLIFTLSIVICAYILNVAEQVKNCDISSVDAPNTKSYPRSAFEILTPCKSSATSPSNFLLASLSQHLFGYTTVAIATDETSAPLLHLGSTSRFELLYDPAHNKPLVLAKGVYFSKAPAPLLVNLSPLLSKLQEFFDRLERRLTILADRISKIEHNFNKLEKNRTDQKNGKTSPVPSAKPPARAPSPLVLSKECLTKRPDLIITYALNKFSIPNAHLLNRLRQLGRLYETRPTYNLIIFGYADPSGSVQVNAHISAQRAKTVAALLLHTGLSPQRVHSMGLGTNNSETLPQRRVEIRVCPISKKHKKTEA